MAREAPPKLLLANLAAGRGAVARGGAVAKGGEGQRRWEGEGRCAAVVLNDKVFCSYDDVK